jgi:hypothetical protein
MEPMGVISIIEYNGAVANKVLISGNSRYRCCSALTRKNPG